MLPAPNLATDVFYTCTSANRESVIANEAKHQWGFPILRFDGSSLKKERTNAKFKDPSLEKLFTDGIQFPHEPTFSFFPFGEGDSEGWIAEALLYRMAVMWNQGKQVFTLEQLVNECHPLLGFFGRDQRRHLLAVARSVLTEIARSPNQKFSVKAIRGDKWQIVRFTTGKLMRKYISLFADTFDKKGRMLDLEQWLQQESMKEEES